MFLKKHMKAMAKATLYQGDCYTIKYNKTKPSLGSFTELPLGL